MSQRQDQFVGMFRGRGRVPAGSVYDAINALILDELLPARRGGSALKSGSAADGTLLGLWDGMTVAGQRTLFWSATSPYVLAADDSSILDLGSVVPVPLTPGVELGGLVFFRSAPVSGEEAEIVYAGSRKTAPYSTGTIAYTNGSPTVAGTGTSWLANVDAGMILTGEAGTTDSFIGVVKSVESNTSLTLTRGVQQPTSSAVSYNLDPVKRFALTSADTPGVGFYKNPQASSLAVAGQRLARTRDNRVYYSKGNNDDAFLKTAGVFYPIPVEGHAAGGGTPLYHELPRASLIIGSDSLQDVLILFATSGVWTIENMALDALDDFGNPQRPIRQVSQDLILWGESGIAGWAGQLVVPAIDDVYVVGLDAAPVPVSDAVRPLYRSYVEAGYQPGLATVYRGHYFLPIVDSGNALVDVLVCRLDLRDFQGNQRPGWVRWANHAAGGAYATRVGGSSRTPKLLGINGTRVTDLTGCFSPAASNKADADGTNHALQIVTQDVESGAIEHTFTGARVALELADAATDDPTFTVEYASGPRETESWASAGSRGESDGERPEAFRFVRRARAVRLRVTTVGPCARAVLRAVEVFFRPRGRG